MKQRRRIRVFPDHASTGLWDFVTGESLDCGDVNLDMMEIMALTYWHEVWEFFIATEPRRASDEYVKRWIVDGSLIVFYLNKHHPDFEFVYDVTEEDYL